MATLPHSALRTTRPGATPRRRTASLGPTGTLIAQWIALAGGYVLLDAASFLFWLEPVPVKPWNPQVGLAVAILCLGGLRLAPAVFLGAMIAEAWLRNPDVPWALHVPCALALTCALVAVAAVLRRRGFPRLRLGVAAMRDFFAIVVVGTFASALAYVAADVLLVAGDADVLVSAVLHKWLGDALGVAVVAPLLFTLLAPRERAEPVGPTAIWQEVALFAASLAVVLGVALGGSAERGERMFYLLFLPLVLVAVRRGVAGASVALAAVQAAVVVGLWLDGRTLEDATNYQILMVALAATTLMLGAVVEERRRTQRELERRSAELRAQQQALADAMRVAAASETASTLAHEMSQPLSAIGTYARAGMEMLQRGSGSREDLASVLERIVAESARTRESVQRIREFFRTGKVRREAVEVEVLAADAQDALRDQLQAAGVALTVDLEPGLPPVDVDRVQVGTVLHNLVGNAIHALGNAEAPRWIRLSARRAGDSVAFDVADSGPGIDPAVRMALFEPLTTTKPTGMGLGLPIARTLVHAHGGRLDLAAEHPTTFRFTLPIHGHDDP
jgi:signal transduction histidine kinase